MNRRRWFFCLAVPASVAVSLAVSVRGVAQPEEALPAPPPFQPVMTLHGLMEEQNRHFESIAELRGAEEAKDRFNRMNHEAMALAEMANINGFHERSMKFADYRD